MWSASQSERRYNAIASRRATSLSRARTRPPSYENSIERTTKHGSSQQEVDSSPLTRLKMRLYGRYGTPGYGRCLPIYLAAGSVGREHSIKEEFDKANAGVSLVSNAILLFAKSERRRTTVAPTPSAVALMRTEDGKATQTSRHSSGVRYQSPFRGQGIPLTRYSTITH
ncbi:hypothetical protein HPB50_000114 [Hyalomma asiaticum]|uniref:Uncharacterized protein n=1 Tax=Hyalomma asiaticum TaxID=266040 RepID=A0ACB7T9Y0_HYAAI|nr:hypothetical protein HPB50_000114 [Hyalomma asiaticum]